MNDTLDKISNLYSENLSEHGDQSKAVGWSTTESQELRFEKLTELIPVRNDSFSINDYGCGYELIWRSFTKNTPYRVTMVTT